MINVIIILILLIGAVSGIKMVFKRSTGSGCCGSGGNDVPVIKPHDRKRSNYLYRAEMTIENMKCINCAQRVQNALNSLDGVWAKVKFKKKTAYLLLKQNDCREKLIAAVAESGYTPSITDIKLR